MDDNVDLENHSLEFLLSNGIDNFTLELEVNLKGK